MNLTGHTAADHTLVSVRGRFDVHQLGDFDTIIAEARHSGTRAFIVDLADVTFIDIAAIDALKSLQASCAQPTDFALANPSQTARIVLELSGVDRHFRTLDLHPVVRGKGAGHE